jgi:hypothetical protein
MRVAASLSVMVDAAVGDQPRLPDALVAVLSVPLVADAIAIGLGSDVAAWCAPWALLGSAPFLGGRRVGRCIAALLGGVALAVGVAPLAGLVGGVAAGEYVLRGGRVRRAGLVAVSAGVVVVAAFATIRR